MSFLNCSIISKDTDADAYHAGKDRVPRGTPEYAVSWSALKEFGHCPARFKAGYAPPDSDAKRFGSLLDTLLLTPEQFSARYAVKPETYINRKGEVKPWNGNADVCDEWLEDHSKLEIVSRKETESCQQAIASLRADEIIASFLDASDKQVLVRGQWADENTGLVIPTECLIDLVPRTDTEFAKCVGDLKTTRNAGLIVWQRFAYSMGYHGQAAFNLGMLSAALPDEDRNTFCFLLLENFPPWQTGKRLLSQDFLTLGKATVNRLMANYAACVKSGRWPGYDETDEQIQGWGMCDVSPWQAEGEAFAPKYDFSEPTPDDAPEPDLADVPTP